MAEIDDIRDELAEAREEIANLKIKTTTTLSGAEFMTLLLLGQVVAAFVILGTIIIYKASTNPAEVAPHLDIILVAFAIFATPTGAGLAAITSRFAEEGKRKGNDN